jgi:glyoxylate reductase
LTGACKGQMAKVFVSCTLPGDAVAQLAGEHQVVVGEERVGVSGPAFLEAAGTFDALVSLFNDRVDVALLDRAPRLRVVANFAVGYDNVDVAACAARGIVVTNTPGVLSEATADLAFGLLLSTARRITEGDRLVRRGAFQGLTPSFLLGAPVHGATLGIVGLGRIGQAMARRARGFGMRVLYANRTRAPAELERALGATAMDLDELFGQADIVSLHCPLTPETHHLVNARRLARMKPGAILINTTRGSVVDEPELASALASGPLGGAGLDVYEEEPRVYPALLALENVVLAPHIGSADRPTREAMGRIAAENVLAVLAGRPALNSVRLP